MKIHISCNEKNKMNDFDKKKIQLDLGFNPSKLWKCVNQQNNLAIKKTLINLL